MYNSFKALQLINDSGQDGEDPEDSRYAICCRKAAERL